LGFGFRFRVVVEGLLLVGFEGLGFFRYVKRSSTTGKVFTSARTPWISASSLAGGSQMYGVSNGQGQSRRCDVRRVLL